MKKLIVPLLLIIASLAYGQETWKICFLDIFYDGKNISDIVSRAVKSSVSGFLKRDFTLIKITNTQPILSKNDAYLIGLSNNVEFVIIGYVTYENQTINLTLELIDVANKIVKLSKYYNFNYDADEVFNTIDTIVVDFTEGIKKAIPKYEEKTVIEYREKIRKQQIQLEIPGTFIPSVYLSAYIGFEENYNMFSIYPEISLKYQTTRGSIFNNGWFIGLNSIISLVGINHTSDEIYDTDSFPWGMKFNIYFGVNIINWLGVGTEIIFYKEVPYIETQSFRKLSIDFFLTPMLKFSFGYLDIYTFLFLINTDGFSSVISIQQGDERDEMIFSVVSFEIRATYKISKDLNIEFKAGFDRGIINLLSYEGHPIEITTTGLSLGVSLSKSFSF